MKKKININLMLLATIAIVAMLISMTGMYYKLYQNQVLEDLKIEAELIKKSIDSNDEIKKKYTDVKEMRVTWINKDGTVLYDNEANEKLMENHKKRKEVREAFENKHGSSIRESNTLRVNTFYYATLLDDGTVLRVAREAGSIWNFFEKISLRLTAIVLEIFIISMLLSHLLTKRLVAPIKNLASNIDIYSEEPIYKELVPFVTTIRKQHENILEASKMRQDFTANVSHELKTPLTAISGYAELIENKIVTPEQSIQFAVEIRKNAQRLLSLINDIIRLSELDRTEEGYTNYEEVDLYDVAEEVVNSLEVSAQKRGVSVELQGESTVIRGDREMLGELVQNLGENACKYNNEGGKVWIKICTEKGTPTLYVKDNGIGIPKEHQQRIFERFYRVDKSRSKATGGTGLGLAIVKHIVAIHNATIELESESGKGTEIKVSF